MQTQPITQNAVVPKPQTKKSGNEFNAVNINIYNPTATPGNENDVVAQQPLQETDAKAKDNTYEYPQANIYGQTPMVYPYQQLPMAPVVPQPIQQVETKKAPEQKAEDKKDATNNNEQPEVQETPQAQEVSAVPQPVLEKPPVEQITPVVPVAKQIVSPEELAGENKNTEVTKANVEPTANADIKEPQVKTPETETPVLDVKSFAEKLNGDDLNVQSSTIEEIADISLSKPDVAPQLMKSEIIDGLLNVINKDTKSLTGPTPKQLELRAKEDNGGELTTEEKEEAAKISDLDIAERNKQYALYTVAILQKNIAQEVEKESGLKPDVNTLPGIEQVVQSAKTNESPMIRQSALAALDYINTPEYAPVVNKVFEGALKDSDPLVQATAKEALAKAQAPAKEENKVEEQPKKA